MSLNDPHWGRSGADKDSDKTEVRNDEPRRDDLPESNDTNHGQGDDRRNVSRQRDNNREPASDLDQLWEDFNKAINGMLGGKNPGVSRPQYDKESRESHREDPSSNDGGDGREPPRYGKGRDPFGGMRRPGRRPSSLKGAATLLGVLLVGWAASGIYIVPEGQVGVVTTFGRYSSDSAAGINWRLPWPIQDTEIVDVSSVRKAEIGIRGSARLQEALMLTDDENIVDVQFNVQYRIKPHAAKDFLFRSRNPDQSVLQAAESAMREVVGRKTMDSVLFESKQEIAESVKTIMQNMLDRYHTGIEVMSVAIQNAQPPQPVQAAFNDAVKAGQDRERQINEGQAYANAVIPKANGMASRLTQEAQGYKTRVVETATGDAERFGKVLSQYEKAPEVTRDRLYIDTMRDIYANTKKVLVESKSGSNLLYLPFDKLMEKSAQESSATNATETPVAEPASQAAPAAVTPAETRADFDPRAAMRQRSRY